MRDLPALVIFDMAGTTVEDRGQVPAAFADTLAANGITLTPDEITQIRGASKREAIRRLLQAGTDADVDRVYVEFRKNLARTYATQGVDAIAGAGDVFKELRRCHVKVALSTGFDRDTALLLLSAVGWTRQTVDVVVCGDDVAAGRPAPDMILLAMRLAAVSNPGRVANVGDTTLDLESAARAGVRWNIGVLSGAHAKEALERAPHTHLLDSVADLLRVF